jgi:hypothetical protein
MYKSKRIVTVKSQENEIITATLQTVYLLESPLI